MSDRGPDDERRVGGSEDPDRAPDPEETAAADLGDEHRSRRDPKDLDSSEAGRPPDTAAAAASVGPAPTGAVPGGRIHEEAELPDEVQPKGAIMVTSFTAIVILVSWFAVLALFMARG